MSMSRSVLVFALVAALAGCGGREPLRSNADLVVTSDSELPAPAFDGGPSGTRAGAIGPFDKLSVQVVGLADLSLEDIQVDPTGHFSMPTAGRIQAAGRTPAEVSEDIRRRLRAAYIRDPQVAVNIREMVSYTFTVDGAVTQPGRYPAIGDVTLMKAIATARGVTEYSKLDDVVVFRTVNDRRMAALYNLSAIRRGRYADPRIYANDTVVVGDSPARRLFRDLIGAGGLLAGPIIALIQR